ncbi:MAG: ribulose-phosphate 3-epimerase, partial [candidate division Zixibacteria bacterium CG_4_9_14_3_um_filter_46_8]
TLSSIKNLGGKAGIALNPATPAQTILPFIDMLSLILIMTVNPGFGGQDFIPEALEKVDLIREHIRAGEHKPLLSVDGGINSNTALLAKEKGVNVLAAGSYIFKSTNYRTAIQSLR